MYTTLTTLRGQLGALVAICALGIALVAAGPAHAKPRDEGRRGCPVEHENGRISYAPVGSQFLGLFTCGSDGEWHFGWAINP